MNHKLITSNLLLLCLFILTVYGLKVQLKDDVAQEQYESRQGYIYLEPQNGATPDFTILFIHGLSSSGAAYKEFFDRNVEVKGNYRLVLVQAPQRSTGLKKHAGMTSWFDFLAEDIGKSMLSQVDQMSTEQLLKNYKKSWNQTQLLEDSDIILDLIKEESDKYSNDQLDTPRIFLGGHSQGCMLSMATLLKYDNRLPLRGVFCLSGPQPIDLNQLWSTGEIPISQKQLISRTPLFLDTGENDEIFPTKLWELSYKDIIDAYGDSGKSENLDLKIDPRRKHGIQEFDEQTPNTDVLWSELSEWFSKVNLDLHP